jgi:hypothetical protein
MAENKGFNWSDPGVQKQGEPVAGEVAIVNLPVKVVFVWRDDIVEDVDEHNNPVSYRSGYAMEYVDSPNYVYTGQPRTTMWYTNLEKESMAAGSSLSVKDIENLQKKLEKSGSPVMQEMWAFELLSYPDELFIKIYNRDDITVIGGVEQMKLIDERIKILGL